jgi:hypothetical protein
MLVPELTGVVGHQHRFTIPQNEKEAHLLRTAIDEATTAWRAGQVETLYTVATTEDGGRMARKLGFTETKRRTGPLGDDRVAFRLNMAQNAPTDAFVRRYQQAVKNQTRRAK